MEYLTIEDLEFDNFSDEQLETISLSFHDGDDQSVYNWHEIVHLLSESDIEVNGEYKNGFEFIKTLPKSKIMDIFYNELELNGNNSIATIFKNGKFWQIHWQSTY